MPILVSSAEEERSSGQPISGQGNSPSHREIEWRGHGEHHDDIFFLRVVTLVEYLGLRRGRHPGAPVEIGEVALNEVYLLLGGEFISFIVGEYLPLEEPQVLPAGLVQSGEQLDACAGEEQPGEVRGEDGLATAATQVYESIDRWLHSQSVVLHKAK